MHKALKYAYPFVFVFMTWWLASKLVQSMVLPDPLIVFGVLVDQFADKLGPALVVSYGRLFAATGLAILLGASLGMAAGLHPRFGSWVIPIVQIFYPVPRVAFLPLFLIAFGLNEKAKVALMVAVSIFYFIIPIYDQVKNLPENYRIIAKTLDFTYVQWLKHVVFPACLSEFFTATKMTLGASMATLFFAENIAGSSGIAFYIMNAWSFSNYPAMYAGIVTVAIAGILVFWALDWLEAKLMPWR